jgi:hypothetical protein
VIGGETNTPKFAIHWASQLEASPLSLERLSGGINNRVFRCGNGRRHWVIKGFSPAMPRQRDRMQAEVEFLRFAAQAAPGFTPALIQVDPERRCVVLEHLEGEAFPEGVPPSEGEVREAVNFFHQLNAERRLAQRTIHLDAAEGFLRLRELIANVRERLERITYVHLDPHSRPQAKSLLGQIYRELDDIEERINKMIDKGIVSDEIDPDLRCISPSDFGFHNAVRTTRGVFFIDFEFAGWDDPAKAAQDFILQPRIPVRKELSPLIQALPLAHRSTILRRCDAIGPALAIKWVCIQLAVLQPARLEEILAVMPEQTSETLIKKRLQSANQYLRQIQQRRGSSCSVSAG